MTTTNAEQCAPRPRCIVVLSSKSSGSSACQRLLASVATVNLVEKTRHRENETLYWTKAASVLGLPQQALLDSEIPIPVDKARQDLVALLEDNIPAYRAPFNDESLVFDGWRALCHHYAPIFLEKSPHHLHQKAALDLLVQCMERCPDIDFLLIGLIRNPMDTLYSMFQRWRTPPEAAQYEWLIAYRNLLDLADRIGNRLLIVRYEDMVTSTAVLAPVYDFMDVAAVEAAGTKLHSRSLAKWRNDERFGFQLAPEVQALATQFGYAPHTMANDVNRWWPLYRRLLRTRYKVVQPPRRSLRSLWRNSKGIVGG